MLLKNLNGSGSLELHIERFQFADNGSLDPDDLQWHLGWLIVTTKAFSADGSWKHTDPCLTFREAKWLIEWLRGLAAGETEGRIDFTEPNISFELLTQSEGEATIRAYFELESRPPWKSFDHTSDEDDWRTVYIDLAISSDDALRAANSLIDDLKQLPPRRGLILDVG